MRYWRPWRLFVIWLHGHAPSKIGDRMLDYLYPDDCVIEFSDD